MIDLIKLQIIPILKKYGVSRASLFGSVVRGDDKKSSDVDILVEVGKNTTLFDMIDIKSDLEKVLKKKVDLVEYKGIKSALRDNILSSQLQIYKSN
ncbi:nucleotidyltransferase family protein [Candidatus Roizmanbacteria bacterium]|nr:nucleotidyltransferase family protein [Candidatus Roizmanbacteria bacterium]